MFIVKTPLVVNAPPSLSKLGIVSNVTGTKSGIMITDARSVST